MNYDDELEVRCLARRGIERSSPRIGREVGDCTGSQIANSVTFSHRRVEKVRTTERALRSGWTLRVGKLGQDDVTDTGGLSSAQRRTGSDLL